MMNNNDSPNIHVVGTFKLLGDVESACGTISTIIYYLDVRSLTKFIQSSFLKQLTILYTDNVFQAVCNKILNKYQQLIKLNAKYLKVKRHFSTFNIDLHVTPFIAACENGEIKDAHFFLKTYNLSQNYMRCNNLKEFISEVGRNSYGKESTALISSVRREKLDIVELLVKNNVNIERKMAKNGWTALHYAAQFNSTMDIMQFLLNESTTLGIINERSVAGWSPLDVAYNNFNNNAKEDIIKLLKQHGGKAYKHLEDGTYYDGKT